ncbi:MAG: polysaccharide deacetylase family protein, partial [Cyanobacteriota bacterium]|nr:polysaccharide deacetylase family protein [Cyanobacteriota bacterium]
MKLAKVQSLIHNIFPKRYFQRHVQNFEPVPAYFYHQIEASEFEQICKLIIQRNFQALTINQLLDHSFDPKAPALLLTMDDGWSSVWSIAFPLARKYGIRLTLFLVPDLIEDSSECRSTLDDSIDPAILSQRDLSDRAMLT